MLSSGPSPSWRQPTSQLGWKDTPVRLNYGEYRLVLPGSGRLSVAFGRALREHRATFGT